MLDLTPKFLLLSLLLQGSSQDTLMRSKPQEPSVLPYAPVTQQQQSVISYSAKNLGPIARPKR